MLTPKAIADNMHSLCNPVFFDLNHPGQNKSFQTLFVQKPFIQKYDTVYNQLSELFRCQSPEKTFSEEELSEKIRKHTNGNLDKYGYWVYYPWSERMVHVLPEEEFITLRTDRNRNKITIEERNTLSTKKIGVVGLSVGQSVALTLAMERACGELRIADFDTLEITNLNRIRTGLHNLSLPKTVVVAREIAEIDPYLKVVCFHEGLTAQNMESFFLENGALDIVVDECDSLNIKLGLRRFARKHKIPVVMDTSDRGMLDIERFDLDAQRPLLHGLFDEKLLPENRALTDDERIKLSIQIAGMDSISERLKKSLPEIKKTISTWPQLASAVAMGGAVATEVCRLIALGQHSVSGRFYIDVQKIIGVEKNQDESKN